MIMGTNLYQEKGDKFLGTNILAPNFQNLGRHVGKKLNPQRAGVSRRA